MDIIEKKLGDSADVVVKFEDGKLVVEAKGAKEGFEGSLVIKASVKVVLDAIKEKIPGQVDDAIINLIEAALLK